MKLSTFYITDLRVDMMLHSHRYKVLQLANIAAQKTQW